MKRDIYMLWMQGWNQAPALVQYCVQRWEELNPTWTVHLLTERDVWAMADRLPYLARRMRVQALSNLVRLTLLDERGGVWADATTLPLRPLDDWLVPRMSPGFFAFADPPGPDRILSNWFLASQPGHVLAASWRQGCLDYWDRERTLLMDPRDGDPIPEDPTWWVSSPGGADTDRFPYFWCHYTFGALVERRPEVRNAWTEVETLPSSTADPLRHMLRSDPNPDPVVAAAAVTGSVLQKLDWRLPAERDVLVEIVTEASALAVNGRGVSG